MLLVVMSSVISESRKRSTAMSVRTACVTAALIDFAPCCLQMCAALVIVPAVVVRSSTSSTLQPSTSPIR